MIEHLCGFQVVELRRYTVREGELESFARYFDAYFPEALQQLGAIALGQFLERGDPPRFTWLRGFHDVEGRARANTAFYDGPLWKEHAATMNDRMLDFTNVLLLRPLSPEREVAVLPAVDPVREAAGAERGARGVVAAQVFTIRSGGVDAFAEAAEEVFRRYRDAGAREAGVLVTLEEPNNFPRHPVRTDGPHLVWLGVLPDDRALEDRFRPAVERALPALSAKRLLREAPELLILDPTGRSRLRWMPEWQP